VQSSQTHGLIAEQETAQGVVNEKASILYFVMYFLLCFVIRLAKRSFDSYNQDQK